jgi:hypothetical protein
MSQTIKISNPTPYKKSIEVFDELTGEMKKEPVSYTRYIVTGSPEAVALYYKDQCEEAERNGKPVPKKTDEGHPMKHFRTETVANYGDEAILTRGVKDGIGIYFIDENNTKILNDLMSKQSAYIQRSFADKEVEKLIALSKTLAKNGAVNRTQYQAKLASLANTPATTQEEAELNKF